VNRENKIRETTAHRSKNVLQTFKSGALPRKRNLLDYILPDKLRGSVDLTLGDYFVDETTNYS
jgi:hypothetical protein